jgi:uncharacterized membrane protein HdeD (DUF308 family)
MQFNAQSKNNSQWGVLLGIPLIGLGIAIGLQSQNSTLVCDRTTPTKIECKLLQENVLGTLLGQATAETHLGVLQGADTMVRLNTNGETYQLVLRTTRGETELKNLNQAGNPEDLATRINDFMIDRQETALKIEQDDRWFSGAFGGILVLVGVWKLITFNKSKPQPLPFSR